MALHFSETKRLGGISIEPNNVEWNGTQQNSEVHSFSNVSSAVLGRPFLKYGLETSFATADDNN